MGLHRSVIVGAVIVVCQVVCGGDDTGATSEDGTTVGAESSSGAITQTSTGGTDATTTTSADTGSSSIAETSDTTATTGAPGCARGEVCAAAVPPGWEGPVVVYVGDADATPPECPTSNEPAVLDAFTDLAPAVPAECVCACGDPTGAECDADSDTVEATAHTQANCGQSCGGASDIPVGACVPIVQGSCGGNPNLSMDIALSPPNLDDASCAPSLEKTVPEAPAFGSRVRVCEAAATTTCGGGMCVSDDQGSFQEALCIVQAGDVGCTDPVYSQKMVVYESVEDSRDCESCTCGDVSGSTCAGSMSAHGSVVCGDNLGDWPVPGCVPWLPTPATTYIRFNLSASGGSCTPSNGAPSGGVVPQEPSTICCDA